MVFCIPLCKEAIHLAYEATVVLLWYQFMLLNDVGAPEFFIQQLAIGWKVTI
jgi:hypothetical protein